MSFNTKNYKTDNGDKWVVGGELAIDGGVVTKDGEEVEFGEGAKGDDGKSAYEIAVDNGFEGTEEEWLESLKGSDGEDGTNGTDGRGIENIERDGNMLVFTMTDNTTIEVDLPNTEPEA